MANYSKAMDRINKLTDLYYKLQLGATANAQEHVLVSKFKNNNAKIAKITYRWT